MAETYADNRPFAESWSASSSSNNTPWQYLITTGSYNTPTGPYNSETSNASMFRIDDEKAKEFGVQQGQQDVLVFADANGNITQSSWRSESGWIREMQTWDSKTVKRYQVALKKAGILPADYVAAGQIDAGGTFINAMLAVGKFVSSSNLTRFQDAYHSGKLSSTKPMTIDQYLKEQSKNGSKNLTSTVSEVSTFTEANSRAILEQFYADALGRRPTDDEVIKFNSAVNAAAKKKPNVTTSVSNPETNAVSRTTKSGFGNEDAALMARTQAEAAPGAHGFMTSTKYMDAFMGMLKGKVGQ